MTMQSTKQKADFINQVTKHLLLHISDSEYSINHLCGDMAMSRTMFYLKLKSYTGQSPREFVRIFRLDHAAVLLRCGHCVSDVAAEVGFGNTKYFSTAFKKYFGISPSKFK